MEALLSKSFDNLSSFDQPKIRKGLRQVEGLLAQICLSSASNRHSAPEPTKEPHSGKSLADLASDAAFREFFKLQDGFEWNVAIRLVNCLDRLLGKSHDEQNDLLIVQALELIQGVLLLHPPSRALFSRELYMNHLLDLLEPINCPAIQSATIITLVCALIDTPQNTRTFENLDGLLTITSLFKSRETSREVKLKLVEFLYFYLMPETASSPATKKVISSSDLSQHTPSKLPSVPDHANVGVKKKPYTEIAITRFTEEKQALLGRHLSSVEDLVADLRQGLPFDGALA
ncbi:hypothetical protein K3495_g2052 [Podosphaera aphanis]|nr:hypothetical protein K3495_g2052 [Podosphaera aphanis]